MTDREAAVAADAELVASIKRGIDQAHAGQTTHRSFAGHEDED